MNKVEAAREWICSHNDGDVLYVKDAFVSGVDWAIDKACEWLEEHADTYIGVEGLPILSDKFFSDFKKAMEE